MRPGLRSSVQSALLTISRVLRISRYRRMIAVAALVYLVIYLYSLQHLIVLPAGVRASYPILGVQLVEEWPAKLWRAVAPFSYEPVVALYLARRIALFLAVPNLLLGVMLGVLVGLNLAIAAAHFAMQRACRRPGVGLLGTLPSLLTGFTCCVPTVALALGANSVLALIALRSYFVPASILLLSAGVLWGAGRAGSAAASRTAPAELARATPS